MEVRSAAEAITLAIALYGALLSTVLGVLSILRYLAERVRIRPSAWYGISDMGVYPEPRDVVILQAVNVGKRPVTLVSGSLVLADGRHLIPNPPCRSDSSLPCKLEEGDVCTLWAPAEAVTEAERQSPSKVVAVCFRDAANREFRSKFHTRPTMAELEQGEE